MQLPLLVPALARVRTYQVEPLAVCDCRVQGPKKFSGVGCRTVHVTHDAARACGECSDGPGPRAPLRASMLSNDFADGLRDCCAFQDGGLKLKRAAVK